VGEKEEKIRRCPIPPALWARASGWIRAADRNVSPSGSTFVRTPARTCARTCRQRSSQRSGWTIELNARLSQATVRAARHARYPVDALAVGVISAEALSPFGGAATETSSDTGVDAVAGCADERNAPLNTNQRDERGLSRPLLRRAPRPTAANTTEGSAAAGSCVALACHGGSRGPRDLLTRVAYPRQDGPRALQRGLRESIATAV
jgi:hypothetical protein